MEEKDFLKILKEEELNCAESFLFDRSMKWYEKNEKKTGKKNLLEKILKKIRFTQFSLKELSESSNHHIARSSPLFLELVVESFQFLSHSESLISSPFSCYKIKKNSEKFKIRKKEIIEKYFKFKGESEFFVIPKSGVYRIVCKGAMGSGGGRGAHIEANFQLNMGEIVEIMVGEHKSGLTKFGGGGSFVFLNNSFEIGARYPLIVAGGGAKERGMDAFLSEKGEKNSSCGCETGKNGSTGSSCIKNRDNLVGLGWKFLKAGKGEDSKRTFGGGGYSNNNGDCIFFFYFFKIFIYFILNRCCWKWIWRWILL